MIPTPAQYQAAFFLDLIHSLQQSRKLAEAVDIAGKALTSGEGSAEILFERAGMLRELGRLEECLADYETLVRYNPGNSLIRYQYSLALLAAGRYAEGWHEYERRWQSVLKRYRRNLPVPEWDGSQDIRLRSVFVIAEQNLGDTFQFCRYLQELTTLGAAPVVAVDSSQKALLQRMQCHPLVVSQGDAFPPVTCYVSMMSLPHALGRSTGHSVVEDRREAYLVAGKNRVRAWAQRLTDLPGPRIGLAWRSDAEFGPGTLNALPVADCLPLQQAGTLISLQQDPSVTEQESLHMQGIAEFAEAFRNYDEMAALIANLDLVVAVDSAVAHLAGALGKPCVLLLDEIADWRWGNGKQDSMWYASMQISRKHPEQSWQALFHGSVLETVRHMLAGKP